MSKHSFVSASLFFLAAVWSNAQTPPAAPAATPAPPTPFPAPAAVEKTSQTQHVMRLNGKDLHYTATAGTLVLKSDDGKPRASMFYIAYSLEGANLAERPVTFTFNGGPGSSSVWLHLGALGPRRIPLSPEGEQLPPPYHLVDNEGTALEFTDLVFIDPVSTGFSRNAPGEDPRQFHGLEGDLQSVGEFIRLYTTRYQRWGSPKFLAGESYGTTRAAGLSEHLLRQGIYLNGITLISSVLNFETLEFAPGNDLPYILFLPSYTATAWYHKKLPSDLQSGDLPSAIREAEKFASTDYTAALMKGDLLSAAERDAVAHQLARFTGLSVDYVTRSNLRVLDSRFDKELLRLEGKTVGRYDSRLTGTDADGVGETGEYDPSYASVQGAYTAAFNEYVRTELKWESDLPYEILTGKVWPWSYKEFENSYVNVAERLRKAMTQNPAMKVMVANGYYDLATPFFATEYTFHHLGLDPKLTANVSMTYCDAGHMHYTKQNCLLDLHKNMAAFYRQALTK